jgi:hypothetical protein
MQTVHAVALFCATYNMTVRLIERGLTAIRRVFQDLLMTKLTMYWIENENSPWIHPSVHTGPMTYFLRPTLIKAMHDCIFKKSLELIFAANN